MVQIQKYKEIRSELDRANAELVAVSKFKSTDDIQQLYELGHRDFGENYVQELLEKKDALPKDIRWHFIGNLQRNKVKYIADFIHLIHGVDSFRLAREINKQAERHGRTIGCLLQMAIADEETKAGMDEKEMIEFFEQVEADPQNAVTFRGVMGMATFTEDEEKIRAEFRQLKTFFHFIKNSYFIGQDNFSILSMGMSNDYRLALEEGSNLVRIGSLLFGKRS